MKNNSKSLHVVCLTSFHPSDAKQRPRSWSALAQVVVCCLEALSPNLIRCWLKVYPCGASQFLWGYYLSLDKTHKDLHQIFTKSSHKDLHQILQWVKRIQKLTLVVRERNNFAVNVHRIFLYARLKKRTYYAVAMSVCPSVRPSGFSGLFFNMLWDINLKHGIYIQ